MLKNETCNRWKLRMKTKNNMESNGEVVLPHSDKMPWLALIQIFGIVASDALNLSLISSLIPDMCEKRFGIKKEWIGFASGAVLGSYSFANFFGGTLIGHISDLIGRKPVILIGLATGTISNVLFPFSLNVWVAILIRAFAGFTNNNNAICRAFISDITVGNNRTVAYAYQGGVFAMSRAFSSAIAAFSFGFKIPIWPVAENPYFLPCFIGGLVNLASFIGSSIALSETNKNQKKQSPTNLMKLEGIYDGLKAIYEDKLLLKLLCLYSFNSWGNGSLLLAIILLSSTQEPNGLSLSVSSGGIAMLIFGSMGAIYQFSVGNYVNKRFGIHCVYTLGGSMLSLAMFTAPLLTLIPRYAHYEIFNYNIAMILVWFGLVSCLTLSGIGFMCALPSVSTMIANAADPTRQGITQGTNQSIASLLRGFGPLIMGTIFSVSISYNFPFVLYWILSIIYTACIMLHLTLTVPQKQQTAGTDTIKGQSLYSPQETSDADWSDHCSTVDSPRIELNEGCMDDEEK